MTDAVHTISEADLLDMAIELFERSDSYSESQPFLSRHYALHAYRLGVHSRRLRSLIVSERIGMIRKPGRPDDGARANRRIAHILDQFVADRDERSLDRFMLGKVGLAVLVVSASIIAMPSSIDEDQQAQRMTAVAQLSAINF